MIGPVELQQVALFLGLWREQPRLDCLGPGQERAGVPPPSQVLLPSIGQTCRGVLAHRLVEPEPGPDPTRIRFQQRSGDQLLNQHTNLAALTGGVPATSCAAARSKPPGNMLSRRNHRSAG